MGLARILAVHGLAGRANLAQGVDRGQWSCAKEIRGVLMPEFSLAWNRRRLTWNRRSESAPWQLEMRWSDLAATDTGRGLERDQQPNSVFHGVSSSAGAEA